MYKQNPCQTSVYFSSVFVFQIEEADVSTGTSDLQSATPSQPFSQATGTHTGLTTRELYFPQVSSLFTTQNIAELNTAVIFKKKELCIVVNFRAWKNQEIERVKQKYCNSGLTCTNACLTGAPMLSRLLEAGPAQFSAPIGFMVSAVAASSAPLSAATSFLLDSSASASAGVCPLTPTSQQCVRRLDLLTSA